jgi:hypothetical protein
MIWRAGLEYGLFAFALGFILGTMRVLAVAPLLGEGLAVLLELPLMLAACWWWAGRIVRRRDVADRDRALAVGLVGFAVLMIGEAGVGLGLMGLTLSQWLADFAKPTPQLGLAAQLLAAAMPLLQARRSAV